MLVRCLFRIRQKQSRSISKIESKIKITVCLCSFHGIKFNKDGQTAKLLSKKNTTAKGAQQPEAQ